MFFPSEGVQEQILPWEKNKKGRLKIVSNFLLCLLDFFIRVVGLVRAVVQRAGRSRVEVDGKVVGKISAGVVVFAGIGAEDEQEDCRYISEKIASLRIFEDEEENESFPAGDRKKVYVFPSLLLRDCRGRRQVFAAAKPEKARLFTNNYVVC